MEASENKIGGAKKAAQTVWVVQKLDWHYNDNWYELAEDAPVKAFLSRADAQKHADALTRAEQDVFATLHEDYAKGGSNLAKIFGGLERMTSLDDAAFVRGVQALNLPLPSYDFSSTGNLSDPWAVIWKSEPKTQAAFWRLLDLLQFYEVVEVELIP